MEKNNQEREALEAEVVSLRKEVKKGKNVQNYANNSRALEELINNQRSYNDRTDLCYKEEEVGPSTTKYNEPLRSDIHVDFIGQDFQAHPWKTIPRWRLSSKYQHIFHGYCYSWGKFGHKAVECRTYPRNEYNSKRSVKYEPSRAQRNINRFEHLRNNIECYKCRNFRHIARDCRLENPPK